jgi:hypothetical protein
MRDVIVVGGGTAGFIAAVAAARNGADTLLLEQSSYLGGTMTGGLVPGMVSLRHQPWRNVETIVEMENAYAGNQVTRGIAQELVDRLIEAGGAFGRKGEASVRVMFDPELMKWVMNSMVKEAGAEVHFLSKVAGVIKEGKRVVGLRTYMGAEHSAKVVIDASGDGEVAALAGAPYEVGEGGDPHYIQPISLYIVMGDVDFGKVVEYLESGAEPYSEQYILKAKSLYEQKKPLTLRGFPNLIARAIENGDYPMPHGTDSINPEAHIGLIRPGYRKGATRYNITMHNIDMAYRVDPTNISELSKAIMGMRDFAVGIAEFFKKYIPGYENSYLLQVADLVGIRESRRVIGDYVLTQDDVLESRNFPDAVGRCGAAVDVHNEEGGKERTKMIAIKRGGDYQVPYRILLPKDTEGLLVAGRCVSSDRISNGSIRQQAGCMVTGQAAGTAAALAAKEGVGLREFEIEKLQGTLKKQGVLIDR